MTQSPSAHKHKRPKTVDNEMKVIGGRFIHLWVAI